MAVQLLFTFLFAGAVIDGAHGMDFEQCQSIR